MKTFNNSDLFTGYLKQLLHEFNLPKIKVYTTDHQQYRDTYKTERIDILGTVEATPDDKTYSSALSDSTSAVTRNVRYFPYIRNGEIQEYVNNEWQNIRENINKTVKYRTENTKATTITNATPLPPYRYVYGDKILNYTKNLKINSNVYDSYTHEYLGDYLRFHRDFLKLNLMPLYNCFSNRACDKLKLQWTIGDSATVRFNSSDPDFKIYMLPIKLFQKYTIAIDSETPIEMCCGIYGDYQDKRDKFARLPHYTYKRVAKCTFSQPFLYEGLLHNETKTAPDFVDKLLEDTADKNALIELAQNECDLKLFLKVPINNTSTIVVLEGDYRDWNGSLWDSFIRQNLSITDEPTKAAKVGLEETDGGYYLYTLVEDSKNYINFITQGDRINIVHNNNPKTVFRYEIPLSTMVTNINGIDYALGVKGTSVELEPYPVRVSGIGEKETWPFVCKFYTDDAESPTMLTTQPEISTEANPISYKLGINNSNTTFGTHYLLGGLTKVQERKKYNKSIINLANNLKAAQMINLVTPLQLLQFNTKEQHPFADRLIEYLIGNAITSSETEISDNVKRAQKALASNYAANNYIQGLPGIWSNEMQLLFYEYMMSNLDRLPNRFGVNHDILGYVDRDVEKFYQAPLALGGAKREIVSLSNIELEEEAK
jgi:hypothetical protein